MKMVYIIVLTLLWAAMVSGKSIQSEKYTFNTKDTEYDDGSHELIIGQLYADSLGTPLKNAHSLKTCEFCNKVKLAIEEDKLNFPVVIEDWNADNITGCLYINDAWKNVWIPLKIYETANESNIILDTQYKLRSSLDGRCGTFPFGLNYTIKWGTESTTIWYNTTLMEGYVGLSGTNWNTIQAASTGDEASNSYVYAESRFTSSGSVFRIRRMFLPFNTTGVQNNKVISGSLCGYVSGISNSDDDGDDFIVVTGNTTQAAYTLVNADYNDAGSNEFSHRIDLGDLTGSAYNCWQLNDAGLNAIKRSPDYVTRFGMREGHDFLNQQIATGSNQANGVTLYGFDPDYPIYLNITYTTLVGDMNIGIFNNTFYNYSLNSIELNKTNGNGTYIGKVVSVNSGDDTFNLTADTLSSSGYEVQGSVKTNPLSTGNENLLAWYSFEESTSSNLVDSYNNYDLNTIGTNEDKWFLTTEFKGYPNRGYKWNKTSGDYFRSTTMSNTYMNDGIFTILFLYNADQAAAEQSFIGFENNNGKEIRLEPGGELRARTWGGRDLGNWNYAYSCKGICMGGFAGNGTHVLLLANGTVLYSEANTSGITVGAGVSIGQVYYSADNMNTTVYDVLFYDTYLTPTQTQQIYNELIQWSNWSSPQTFESGLDANNYSIDPDSSFAQVKFYQNTDGIQPSYIYGYNWSTFEGNPCVPDLTNTSWTDWQNLSCVVGDTMNMTRNLTQYDANYCGGANTTFVVYNTSGYCPYGVGCPLIDVDCTAFSSLDNNCDNEGNDIYFHGQGEFVLLANITNVGYVTADDNCLVVSRNEKETG